MVIEEVRGQTGTLRCRPGWRIRAEDGTGCLGKPGPRPPDVWVGTGGWWGRGWVWGTAWGVGWVFLAQGGERSHCGGSLSRYEGPQPASSSPLPPTPPRSLSSASPGTKIPLEAAQWILELSLLPMLAAHLWGEQRHQAIPRAWSGVSPPQRSAAFLPRAQPPWGRSPGPGQPLPAQPLPDAAARET